MNILIQIGMGISLSACAGLRAWLPLFVLGALARAGYVELHTSFQFLESNEALIVFGIATFIEILGDKIPAVDHTLDVLGTFIRPIAGTLLVSSLVTDIHPLLALVLGIITGGTVSLAVHSLKSIFRTHISMLIPFHAGLGNLIISGGEDIITLIGVGGSFLAPLITFFAFLTIGVLGYIIVRKSFKRKT